MSTFTPGPWKQEYLGEGDSVIFAATETVSVARSFHEWGNGALIAAAPEMLAILKDAERHCGVIELATLRQILAKATGEPS